MKTKLFDRVCDGMELDRETAGRVIGALIVALEDSAEPNEQQLGKNLSSLIFTSSRQS